MKFIGRKETFKVAFDDAPVTGYIVECGVGRGGTLMHLVKKANEGQRVFGFDSFQGLPEDWKMSDDFTWPEGSFACEVPEVEGAEIRVGYFADTLPEWKKEHFGRIAILHFDGDLYSSAVTVLTELNDQIVPGTVLMFDDMYEKPTVISRTEFSYPGKYQYWEEGEYKAFMEWQEQFDRETYPLIRGTMGEAVFRVVK